jgi:O-antigen/teichoic acid export membrane protein
LLGLACFHPATGLLFGSKVPAWYVLLSFSSLVLSYMANPARTYLRALDRAATFSMLDTASTLVLLVLNIVFIAWLKIGIVGVLLSSVLVGVVQFVLLSGWAFYKAGFHFVRHQMRRMLRFGAPLVLANLGLFVLNFSDRFFLQHLRSLEVVGIYALGYKFGYMMNAMVVQPFFVMWQSRMYNVYAQPDHVKIFQQIFAFYSLGLIYAGLAMSLFSPEVVQIMVEPRFVASQDVIPVVVLSYIFYGFSYYAQLGMFLTDRTKVIGVIGAASAGLNIVLNYFLIGYFGMMGAAFATLLSFGFLGAVSYWRSQIILPLRLGLGRMAAAMAIAIALYLACRRWTEPSTVTAVSAKLAILAAYPVLVWKSRILHPSAAATLSSAKGQAMVGARRLLGLSAPSAMSQ